MSPPSPTVALAVSGHGFGHAVRSAQVATELVVRGMRVLARTDAPAWLFPSEVVRLPSFGWPLDVGVAQHDGLDLDIEATRRQWQAFGSAFEARSKAEAQLLIDHGTDIVVADMPPLALAAAARARIPSLALGNFGWDWIYSLWPDFEAPVAIIREAYSRADRLLRLPLHSQDADAFVAFETIEDVPLIARRATRSRADVRAEVGIPSEARAVLLTFGGFDARGFDVAALGRWADYCFVLTPPLSDSVIAPPSNVVRLAHTPSDYVSLLGACDAVVTKPGYGIVADALANHVAVLYTDRGPFREYDVLVQALHSLGRARFVAREDLLAGQLGPHLDALLQVSSAWTSQPMHGASVVAERVMSRLAVRA